MLDSATARAWAHPLATTVAWLSMQGAKDWLSVGVSVAAMLSYVAAAVLTVRQIRRRK